MGRNQAWVVLFCGVAILATQGCRSTDRDGSSASFGDSFTLDVIVLADAVAGESTPQLFVPARFVVLADGTLYAQSPPRIGRMQLPDRIRRLTGSEIASIQTLALEAVGDPNDQEAPRDLQSLHPPGEGVLIATVMSGDGRRDMRRIETADGEMIGPVAAIVGHLHELAWSGNRPEPLARPGPVRYDLGPDPYARYRRGG